MIFIIKWSSNDLFFYYSNWSSWWLYRYFSLVSLSLMMIMVISFLLLWKKFSLIIWEKKDLNLKLCIDHEKIFFISLSWFVSRKFSCFFWRKNSLIMWTLVIDGLNFFLPHQNLIADCGGQIDYYFVDWFHIYPFDRIFGQDRKQSGEISSLIIIIVIILILMMIIILIVLLNIEKKKFHFFSYLKIVENFEKPHQIRN